MSFNHKRLFLSLVYLIKLNGLSFQATRDTVELIVICKYMLKLCMDGFVSLVIICGILIISRVKETNQHNGATFNLLHQEWEVHEPHRPGQ